MPTLRRRPFGRGCGTAAAPLPAASRGVETCFGSASPSGRPGGRSASSNSWSRSPSSPCWSAYSCRPCNGCVNAPTTCGVKTTSTNSTSAWGATSRRTSDSPAGIAGERRRVEFRGTPVHRAEAVAGGRWPGDSGGGRPRRPRPPAGRFPVPPPGVAGRCGGRHVPRALRSRPGDPAGFVRPVRRPARPPGAVGEWSRVDPTGAVPVVRSPPRRIPPRVGVPARRVVRGGGGGCRIPALNSPPDSVGGTQPSLRRDADRSR